MFFFWIAKGQWHMWNCNSSRSWGANSSCVSGLEHTFQNSTHSSHDFTCTTLWIYNTLFKREHTAVKTVNTHSEQSRFQSHTPECASAGRPTPVPDVEREEIHTSVIRSNYSVLDSTFLSHYCNSGNY